MAPDQEQLVKANDIKVEQEDVVNMAKEATRAQFAQYGMMSVPEDPGKLLKRNA